MKLIHVEQNIVVIAINMVATFYIANSIISQHTYFNINVDTNDVHKKSKLYMSTFSCEIIYIFFRAFSFMSRSILRGIKSTQNHKSLATV